MPHDLTHASFFSGVGGLDLGLERAGWHTVSFSEIDPYASAVLAERWPGVPNLGDITDIASTERQGLRQPPSMEHRAGGWHAATLWTGGFPCQDLSVAGKRRGMGSEDERTRSGLAYAFLDLVERHRPPAILLENVPGLLSSNGGKDLGALLGRLAELGYWWAYRILDAQFFGVPQRRRRVFICALHAGAGFGADSAAAVLSVGASCGGHSAEGDEAGEGTAEGPGRRITHTLDAALGKRNVAVGDHVIPVQRPSPHSSGVREADGLAGRMDNRDWMGFSQNQRGELVEHPIAHQLTTGGGKPGEGYPAVYRKSARVSGPGTPETWVDDGLANTLNSFDVGDIRTTHLALDAPLRGDGRAGSGLVGRADVRPLHQATERPDPLPLGLDSHRYRCCGNGVVSNVSEWIGHRLRAAVEGREVKAA